MSLGGKMTLIVGSLSSGFRNPREGWVLLTEEEIFGERKKLRERRVEVGSCPREGLPFPPIRELHENDFIVHMDYGVGLYLGLRHLKIGGVANDYLLLEYLDGDKLYVPVDRLNLIQRYIGSDGGSPKRDRLGSPGLAEGQRRRRGLPLPKW